MGKLFGTDGIRGLAGEMISERLAHAFGRAAGLWLKEMGIERGRMLIGQDTRESSATLTRAISDGLCEVGVDSVMIGVIPTPAVSYLVEIENFNAGVMVSASHNPHNYNGIKMLDGSGVKLSERDEERIEELIGDSYDEHAVTGERGRAFECCELSHKYLGHLKAASAIRLEGLKIGIDASNGSASPFAHKLFSDLGCECLTINATPDGKNINRACGSTDMRALCELVRTEGLDLGIAFDGDADRCLAVDEDGIPVDGDEILAILALGMKQRRELCGNTVVGTVMSNMGLADFLKRHNIDLLRTPVGDKYISECMERNGYALGGEESGHIILKKHARTGDGMLTAIALLTAVKDSGTPLSVLKSAMAKYPRFTASVAAGDEEKRRLAQSCAVQEVIKEAEAKLGSHGRVLVRPSGTEPVIRIMTEGIDGGITEEVFYKLREVLTQILKKS